MPEQLRAVEPSPYEEITAALARIEAGESFRRALRIIRYQLRRDIPAATILPPSVP